jgi:hypothetical protein
VSVIRDLEVGQAHASLTQMRRHIGHDGAAIVGSTVSVTRRAGTRTRRLSGCTWSPSLPGGFLSGALLDASRLRAACRGVDALSRERNRRHLLMPVSEQLTFALMSLEKTT